MDYHCNHRTCVGLQGAGMYKFGSEAASARCMRFGVWRGNTKCSEVAETLCALKDLLMFVEHLFYVYRSQ